MTKTIMIVDDSAAMRQVVALACGAGYEVLEAGDGRQALEKMSSQRVSLVISDVNMPIMDDLTLVAELKKIPACRFTPVLMLTTEGSDKINVPARPQEPRLG